MFIIKMKTICMIELFSIVLFVNCVLCTRADEPVEVPFGSWSSPVTAQDVAFSQPNFWEGPLVDPVTGGVFWVESTSQGVNVVKQYKPETKTFAQWTFEESDVLTRINGHGGGALIPYNDTIFYSNGLDGLVYMKTGQDGEPIQITDNPLKYYADGSYSPKFNVLFYVMEDMEPALQGIPELVSQYVVVINVTSFEESIFPMEADFFASPEISPDGTQLAWIQWSYPKTPWDEAQLVATSLQNDRSFAYSKYIQHSSPMMPRWNSHTELLYVHDASDYSNLYHINKRNFEVSLTESDVDVGKPIFRLGQNAFDINPNMFKNEVIVAVGEEKLFEIDTRNGNKKEITTPYDVILNPVYSIDGTKIYMLAGNSTASLSLVEIDKVSGSVNVLVNKNAGAPTADLMSVPQPVQFNTTDGVVAFGLYYGPIPNPSFVGPSKDLPPLIVNVGHGPAESLRRDLNLEIQFFTSRGFAVLDVDVRGSSGHGREYRTSLNNKWGEYDVDDVIAGANFLLEKGVVDAERVTIRGASLGAYTALSALVYYDTFKAGAIFGGLSDLFSFYEESSKFDKTLIELLIGENRTENLGFAYLSPLFRAQQITAPILFMHGSDDEYINESQSRAIFEALKENGMATSFSSIAGETNEFKKLESVVEKLETELLFYSEIFNFKVSDINRKIHIENLETWRNSSMVENIIKED